MPSNKLRILVICLLVLGVIAAAAVSHAQGWNGSEGFSRMRTMTPAFKNQYERPGIFFVRRPEPFLPPSYSFLYPFVVYREYGTRTVSRNYLHSQRPGIIKEKGR